MSQRSREDIERQFRRDNSKKVITSEPQDTRSVRIIGGEIQGLSHFSRKRPIYLLWGGVLLTALTFFVVMGERNKSKNTSSVATQTGVTNKTPTINNENDNFTRLTDIERAKYYRQVEARDKRITQLLNRAATAFKNGSYTKPKASSALNYYQQILKIDSKNYRAKDGIEAINNRFLEMGDEQLTKGDIEAVEITLKSLRSIQVDSYQATSLAEKIEIFKINQPINDALEKADQAISKGQWVIPAEQSALFYFQQVLELDEQNTLALNGLKEVLKNSILLANAAITQDDIDRANSYVEAINLIAPEHQSLTLLKGRIVDKFTRDIEQELNSLPVAQTQPFVSFNNANDDSNQDTNDALTFNNQTVRSNIIFDQKTPIEELDEANLRLGLNAFNNNNYLRSIELLTPLADKGIARARVRLSLIYSLGLGTLRNRGLAEQYAQQALPAIEKFAEEGRAWAQSDLGSMNAYGLAVNTNPALALAWRQRAADQQYVEAQRDIGDMFYQGNGVERNVDTAIFYYRSAALNGDIESKQTLEALGVSEEF